MQYLIYYFFQMGKYYIAVVAIVALIVIAIIIIVCKKTHESFKKGELVIDLSLDTLKKEVKKDIDALGIKFKK